MTTDITAGIVRILRGPGEETVGTGFVVNKKEGLVVTCAHVVENAHAGPGGIVSLIFYAANDKGEQEATVLPEYWRASNAEDVAFLRLKEEKIPEGVEQLPLGCCGGKTNFSTFGFPGEALTSGRRGAGEVLGLPHEMIGFLRLQLRSEEITNGFSGAPAGEDLSN
jgi:Trypsin-like peptidase domain